MMKSRIILMAMLLLSISAMAKSFKVDGIKYELLNKNKTFVIVAADFDYSGNNKYAQLGDIVIPKEITVKDKTYPVIGIEKGSFFGCGRVVIEAPFIFPNALVEDIRDLYSFNPMTKTYESYGNSTCHITFVELFMDAEDLIPGRFVGGRYKGNKLNVSIENLSFSNSVEIIGQQAFEGCHVENVTISNSVKQIGLAAFRNCTDLKSVVISDSVQLIEQEAFCDCRSLNSLNLGNSVKYIGYRAFANCQSLNSLEIPQSVIQIDADAFCDCSNLTDIVIPNSVTFIGEETFANTGLINVTIPSSVKAIGEKAFSSCKSLQSVTFENGNSCSLSEHAFAYCPKLQSVNGLTITSEHLNDRVFTSTPIGTPLEEEAYAQYESKRSAQNKARQQEYNQDIAQFKKKYGTEVYNNLSNGIIKQGMKFSAIEAYFDFVQKWDPLTYKRIFFQSRFDDSDKYDVIFQRGKYTIWVKNGVVTHLSFQ